MSKSILLLMLCIGPIASVRASGIFLDSSSARSMALGGNNTAIASGPLDALAANPSALSEISHLELDLGGTAAFAHGEFSNRANHSSTMNSFGAFPQGAVGASYGPFSFGLGLITDAAMRANWRFRDAPGGLGGATSYGVRQYESEIRLLRIAFGASYRITDKLSAGATIGLLYNENTLIAPYTFQTEPVLRSAKTLLDLQTDGYGWNAQFGLTWKPVEKVRLGLSYTTESKVVSEGRAYADTSVQLKNVGLGAARSHTAFDAEVTNKFPQIISGGISWQIAPKLAATGQLDWINWENSFDTLDVRLRHSNNRDLNGLISANHIDEDIPLNWRDQFVGRLGLEYLATDHWTMRAGYSYGRNPVPAETLNPLTAVIMEHSVSAGAGYRWKNARVDLAWQWNLPASENVGTSKLAPEYNNSSTRITAHWFGLTTSFFF
ncbi:MAG: putative fatty acid transporter rane protein [Chthoniobacteraceae bacterium]|nr:putative fatty acid transporter rane protein [Chthoniobacteraceae bacterium]